MGVATSMIGVFKTNTKGLCKENIEEWTQDSPRGFNLVFKRKYVVTRDRPLIDI